MEFADYYARENNDEVELLKLLYASMRALANPHLDRELVRRVFELKAMVVNGEYPEVFSCAECQSREELSAFTLARNGLLCSRCAPKYRGAVPLLESAVYALQYVVSTPVEKLYTFTLSEEVMGQFAQVVERFRKKYIEKEFKTLDILQSILNY